MNKNLSDWASLAEIVSGIAVVVTLLLLLLGIRENAEMTRFTAYAGIVDSLEGFDRDILKDPTLVPLWTAYVNRDTSGLDRAETLRVAQMGIARFRILEKAFFGRQYGVIGDSEWTRIERGICNNYSYAQAVPILPGTSGLVSTLSIVLTDEFINHIETACAD